eukprot:TRINITY_DN10162_c0_g1_i1.p2 TRINITY_DN10162_c0_g1~~TRINITY_DN10162_c0_g1_i1.p2  ORF type:complete len:130 (+),score=4.19 TRINITY_DN10162_c0_g1_i1:46-435(+)
MKGVLIETFENGLTQRVQKIGAVIRALTVSHVLWSSVGPSGTWPSDRCIRHHRHCAPHPRVVRELAQYFDPRGELVDQQKLMGGGSGQEYRTGAIAAVGVPPTAGHFGGVSGTGEQFPGRRGTWPGSAH